MSKKRGRYHPPLQLPLPLRPAGSPKKPALVPLECVEFMLDSTHALTCVPTPRVHIYAEGAEETTFTALGFARVVTDMDGVHHIHINAGVAPKPVGSEPAPIVLSRGREGVW